MTYLELDYTVDVHKSRYTEMQAYAVAMLFVYPFGIPALYFVLLFRKRKTLMKPELERTEDESRQVSYLDFLAASYKPEYTGTWKCLNASADSIRPRPWCSSPRVPRLKLSSRSS